jgi:pyruvate formate lyase activating enzyme
MQGCGFRCKYCHNPDTWAHSSAEEYTVDEVLKKALRYQSYWGDEGGITVSGGEPLLQIEFVTELFEKVKAAGATTCIDTAAGPFTRQGVWFENFKRLMAATDLVLLDIKHIDSEKHKDLVGQDNANVLDCAKFLAEINKPVWVRHVLVPGVNSDKESLEALSEFIRPLKNIERVDVLPYHTLGVKKWKDLGLEYKLDGVNPPSKDEVALAKEILTLPN